MAIRGQVPVLAGAAITPGTRITTDANGAAVPAAAGDSVLGVAVTAGVSGQLFEAELTGPGAGTAPAV